MKLFLAEYKLKRATMMKTNPSPFKYGSQSVRLIPMLLKKSVSELM